MRESITVDPLDVARSSDGFYHPATEHELAGLVTRAHDERKSLRVRGSGHSIAAAIYSDAYLARLPLAIDVMLDRYDGVTFDDANLRVTVQAGCHLGYDPRDPTRRSTVEASLVARLDARGWALPDLGGVSHQTVSGFLMTGSAGGSLTYAIEDAVVAIRFIDGAGKIHEARRGEGHLFDAVVCSMGLLGVISTVTLQCIPRYDLIGEERISSEDATGLDLFGDSFPAALRRHEYARLIWWPQPGVRRVSCWSARRMTSPDYDASTGPKHGLRPKPYRALGDAISNPAAADAASYAAQWIAGASYDAMDGVTAAQRALTRSRRWLQPLEQVRERVFENHLVPAFLRSFVPIGDGPPQRFWGPWHEVLPMDNAMSETSLGTTFTELWLPLDRCAEIMQALRDHFRRGGLAATGNYAFELYAARATNGWLHPGYRRDSLRFDVFWLERNRAAPAEFFAQFWELLAPFGYRLHWGKHLPADAAQYLRRQFPKWDEFLAVRAELDPHGIFLTRHFRAALGVSEAFPSQHDVLHRRDIFVSHATPSSAMPTPAARVQRYYEELAVEREHALSRLDQLFTDDVLFRDPFRDTRGLAPLRVLFERMFDQYREVDFVDFKCLGDDNAFTLTYTMRLRMAVGPRFSTPMASVFRTRDGKISELTDYYDFMSALVSPLSVAARGYRWLANTFFL